MIIASVPGSDALTVAREAFTAGLNVVGGIGAALFTGLAVLAVVLFRTPASAAVPAEPEPVAA